MHLLFQQRLNLVSVLENQVRTWGSDSSHLQGLPEGAHRSHQVRNHTQGRKKTLHIYSHSGKLSLSQGSIIPANGSQTTSTPLTALVSHVAP